MVRKTILISILTFIISGCREYIEPEIFMIPDNYIGPVFMVTNTEKGQEKIYEGKYRLYNISDSGTLTTKFVFDEGWQNLEDAKYYYVTPDGIRKPIKLNTGYYQIDDEVQIIGSSSSSYADNEIGFKDKIYYKYFIVDTPKNINKYNHLKDIDKQRLKNMGFK